jgi:hypothetical protein
MQGHIIDLCHVFFLIAGIVARTVSVNLFKLLTSDGTYAFTQERNHTSVIYVLQTFLTPIS